MRRRRVATAGAVLAAVGVFVAFAGSSTGSAASGTVTIGASLSLSGDFATDGQGFQRGYELWAKDQNAKGGLLGKTIKLDIVSDASQPSQVTTNYNKLIGSDHDAFVLGPFSTLLTVPASKVVARYGYAFVEGAGGAPSAFGNGLTNVFDVSVPVATNLNAFARWVASLPKSERPKTAAYPTSNDPFTEPQLPSAEKIMAAAGVKTVYKTVFPAEVTDFTPIANQIAADKPDAVVLGSVDVPTVSAFVHAFIQQHYNPKFFIATAGPDQGAAFVTAGHRRPTASRW
jgi:branched-chain amino acid transport system substrate-binding protein